MKRTLSVLGLVTLSLAAVACSSTPLKTRKIASVPTSTDDNQKGLICTAKNQTSGIMQGGTQPLQVSSKILIYHPGDMMWVDIKVKNLVTQKIVQIPSTPYNCGATIYGSDDATSSTPTIVVSCSASGEDGEKGISYIVDPILGPPMHSISMELYEKTLLGNSLGLRDVSCKTVSYNNAKAAFESDF